MVGKFTLFPIYIPIFNSGQIKKYPQLLMCCLSKFSPMKLSFNQRLRKACEEKRNVLCVGLDIDPEKLPVSMSKTVSSLEAFSKDIVDCTLDITPVYKINMAFYESHGSAGFRWLERLMAHIDGRAIVISDGKRGDIGNTSRKYARSVFHSFGFDALTVSPYMGRDAILPFIEDPSKGAFILCLTSNPGAQDFQFISSGEKPLYRHVADLVCELNTKDNLGIVVGATKTNRMEELRRDSDGLSWLVPGIGAQGGNLQSSVKISNAGKNTGIINVSRSIIYSGRCTRKDIRQAAINYTESIQEIL